MPARRAADTRTPENSVLELLLAVMSVLIDPNPEDALNQRAAVQFRADRAAFERAAAEGARGAALARFAPGGGVAAMSAALDEAERRVTGVANIDDDDDRAVAIVAFTPPPRVCALTSAPLDDGVRTPHGVMYERAAILCHLRETGPFCPVLTAEHAQDFPLVEAELESLADSDDEADDERDTAANAELVEAEGRLTLFEAEGGAVAADANDDVRDPSHGVDGDDDAADGAADPARRRRAPPPTALRCCFACGRARPKLVACATCAAAVYCGRTCRNAHRVKHEPFCRARGTAGVPAAADLDDEEARAARLVAAARASAATASELDGACTDDSLQVWHEDETHFSVGVSEASGEAHRRALEKYERAIELLERVHEPGVCVGRLGFVMHECPGTCHIIPTSTLLQSAKRQRIICSGPLSIGTRRAIRARSTSPRRCGSSTPPRATVSHLSL